MAKDKMCKTERKVKDAVFVCEKCGSKAKKEKHLCKPQKIKKEK
jgi:hypothetical protein